MSRGKLRVCEDHRGAEAGHRLQERKVRFDRRVRGDAHSLEDRFCRRRGHVHSRSWLGKVLDRHIGLTDGTVYINTVIISVRQMLDVR
jgi:hypothetical protein